MDRSDRIALTFLAFADLVGPAWTLHTYARQMLDAHGPPSGHGNTGQRLGADIDGQDQPAVRRPGERHRGQGLSYPVRVDPASGEGGVEPCVSAAVSVEAEQAHLVAGRAFAYLCPVLAASECQ
ncbi:hypothetical protein [Streptomyces sp. NPDC012825]|uniref:hypothetical protein n=1 Tax=Streptomyces sp. NPDC012825 TaxID=3364851 RepID=UPI00368F7418